MSKSPRRRSRGPWYAEGLSFECTLCGNCCSGPTGTVFFDEGEGRRMAEALGVNEDEFYEKYCDLVDGRWSLSEVRRDEKSLDCVFLDRETLPGRAVCKVYEARPTQCSTWPFWPENLRDGRTWGWVKENTPCPGMDRGEHFSVEEIEERREEADEAF